VKPLVAVSACLLGERVRWDGRDKKDDWIATELPLHAVVEPVCPEVEIGLGVPRDPLRLVRRAGKIRLVTVLDDVDRSDRMSDLADRRLQDLVARGLSGWIFKARSPSCGLSVEVDDGGLAPGHFAAHVRALLPGLPIAEETSLSDPAARLLFLEAIRARIRSG